MTIESMRRIAKLKAESLAIEGSYTAHACSSKSNNINQESIDNSAYWLLIK